MAARKKRRLTIDTKTQELGEAKLASSGLTLADASILQIQLLAAEQTAALHPAFKARRSLKFNYLDPAGQPLIDWPGGEPFYRLRYLEQDTGFEGLSDKKPPRYVQLPNTAPAVYFPSNQVWPELLANPNQPLIITEGELKAAKACQMGFPTIGLGGVHNWRSRKLGVEWLPSLELIVWLRRNVYICFDSDYQDNVNVCRALHELAEELQRRGAFPHLVTLPALDNFEKVGLDDFLTFAGAGVESNFRQLLTNAEPLGLSQVLWRLNQRYAYVRNPGLIVEQTTNAKITPTVFTGHLEAPQVYQERQLKPDGSISYRAVAAADAWLRWPLRLSVDQLTYQPGQPKLVSSNGSLSFNVWPGWGTQPKAGDVQPFLELIDHLFTGAPPEAKHWFLRWCAYPLQYPGTKLFNSVVLHGVRHGTGKSLLGYTLGHIYGKNFTEISQQDLHNGFNEWAEGKQFVLGDDVTGSNKRQDADFLKKIITQKELRVNAKYMPTYVVPDCINYFFTANHPDSFFLEDDDRRFFIHEVQVGPLSEEFYMEYDLWLVSGGAEAVFDHLLKLDLAGFNPAAPALRTAAKERMIADVRSDLAGWVRQLLAAPDHLLRLGELPLARDLYTSKELLQLYDPAGRTNTTANGLGRELTRAGVRQVLDGRPVRAPDGAQARYYIIRRPERWLMAELTEIFQHLAADGAKKAPKY